VAAALGYQRLLDQGCAPVWAGFAIPCLDAGFSDRHRL
jgi:hypothetical protein